MIPNQAQTSVSEDIEAARAALADLASLTGLADVGRDAEQLRRRLQKVKGMAPAQQGPRMRAIGQKMEELERRAQSILGAVLGDEDDG